MTARTTTRLELRLPAQEKADIEEAARLSGRTVTEYVRTAARDAALTDLARSVIVSAETFWPPSTHLPPLIRRWIAHTCEQPSWDCDDPSLWRAARAVVGPPIESGRRRLVLLLQLRNAGYLAAQARLELPATAHSRHASAARRYCRTSRPLPDPGLLLTGLDLHHHR